MSLNGALRAEHRGRLLAAAATVGLMVGGAACGPIQSTLLIREAGVKLEEARAVEAPKLAPYELTAADAYLHEAREKQGYSDFELSIRFAQKASKLATDAKQKAMAAREETARPEASSSARSQDEPRDGR